ncbi:MAG: RNA polymerase factor sigma-54 [Candidatus Kapabacteria bacterium]|nr:RNA polymerase factor sigma-54 [Candidatus Kapabacteria bacterium]
MKLGLQLNVGLQQTLTPQQIQYLKLLQLPALQMEQHIRQEIEQNPMLEEGAHDGGDAQSPEEYTFETDFTEGASAPSVAAETVAAALKTESAPVVEAVGYEDVPEALEGKTFRAGEFDGNGGVATQSYDGGNGEGTDEYGYENDIPDDSDAFEFHKLLWQDDSSGRGNTEGSPNDDDNDYEPFQMKDVKTFEDELLEQLHFIDLSEEEILLGEQIIGSLDDDGYLRRNLRDVLEEANIQVDEINHERMVASLALQGKSATGKKSAKKISAKDVAEAHSGYGSGTIGYNDNQSSLLKRLNINQAESVLKKIQELDPTGCGARTVQECLIAQLRALPKLNAAQKLAMEVLLHAYESFTMKHYQHIAKQLEVTEDYLREAVDVIRRLNPKPGYGSSVQAITTIIPDFIAEFDEDKSDIIIMVNDSSLPALRVSTAYEKLKKEARYRKFNKETREFLRKKYEDAKFLMNAIRQRKATMLKVMTAIAGLQRQFFSDGPDGLRPLIYKDVAEETGMDISTVCRVVNSKYIQTEFGIFELRFFFSESLLNDEGDEVSTRIIKDRIKEIIGKENKDKPWSDDKLSKEMKKIGFNVARRTVAKYREQMKIPVARMRREL